jgi:hypothetical protein
MTQWQQSDVERCLDCTFSRIYSDSNADWLVARFSSRGLLYILIIDEIHEWISLRSDSTNPDQATPAFEFNFRCNLIRVIDGAYQSESVHFDFANGCNVSDSESIRLVIEHLPSGGLYVWPVIGHADPVHPGLESD